MLSLMAPLPGAAFARTPAGGDPLQSPDCRHAVAALEAQEVAAAPPHASASVDAPGARGADSPGPRVAAARLDASRRQAAKSCLASRADPARALVRPPPLAVAPLGVAPSGTSRQPAATRAGRATPALNVPSTPERPYAITSCDAGGCWANDGSRLLRVGPHLFGPRGACTVQGSLVQCP